MAQIEGIEMDAHRAQLTDHFARGHFNVLSGWLSRPARSSLTAMFGTEQTVRRAGVTIQTEPSRQC